MRRWHDAASDVTPNDRLDHIRAIADLVHRNLQGWVQSPTEWNKEARSREGAESRRRAEAMKAEAMSVSPVGS